jgi:hypothetical protein
MNGPITAEVEQRPLYRRTRDRLDQHHVASRELAGLLQVRLSSPPACPRNRYRQGFEPETGERVERRRTLMRDRGSAARVKYRGQRTELRGLDRTNEAIDAPSDWMPPPGRQSMLDRHATEAAGDRLGTRDEPVLSCRQLLHPWIGHGRTVGARWDIFVSGRV